MYCYISWAVAATLFMAFSLNILHTQGILVNDYDGFFNYRCPDGWFIRGMISTFSWWHQDRLFILTCRKINLFRCRPLPSPVCYQNSTWTNDYEGDQLAYCPDSSYVAAMGSVHDDTYQDRRFNFTCCEIPGTAVSDCGPTTYVNEFEEDVNYAVPYGSILKGMLSFFDVETKDRRFKFIACRLSCSD